MSELPVTAISAAIAAIGLVILSVFTSMRRMKTSISIGDGGDAVLLRRIRVQGNYIEYVPVALILIGLLELGGGTTAFIAGIAVAFGLGRVLHAAGLFQGSLPLTGSGMLLNHGSLLAAAGALLLRYL